MDSAKSLIVDRTHPVLVRTVLQKNVINSIIRYLVELNLDLDSNGFFCSAIQLKMKKTSPGFVSEITKSHSNDLGSCGGPGLRKLPGSIPATSTLLHFTIVELVLRLCTQN